MADSDLHSVGLVVNSTLVWTCILGIWQTHFPTGKFKDQHNVAQKRAIPIYLLFMENIEINKYTIVSK